MQVLITKVANGYLVTEYNPNSALEPSKTHIATTIDGWSGTPLTRILDAMLNPPATAPASVEDPTSSVEAMIDHKPDYSI